jgi:4-amino-4-deoxy-L-arabinose transferase-like glycosyltransferase
MSIAFAGAMLAVLGGQSAVLAGILLGAAVLAKGLVPLALFLPAFWFWRKRARDLIVLLAAAAVVAAPWYVLVSLRNGSPFLEEFFWKHHFARYVSGSLLHARPFWFYAPVLAAGLFPWSPFLLLLFSKRFYDDRRAAFLLAWLAWGFVFFSASRNKLPGYLLPLLPAAAALMGVALAQVRERSAKIAALAAASALLLSVAPAVRDFLPNALAAGLTRAHFSLPALWILLAVPVALCCARLERIGRRPQAIGVIAALLVGSVAQIVWQVYPVLDREVSPRVFWLTHSKSTLCIPQGSRSWRYGLDYYAQRDLPDCN